MTNGSRYDPPTRQLVEQMFALLGDVSKQVDETNANTRAVMTVVYGEGTTDGLVTRVGDLEVSQSVGKRWVAAVTTLISAVMISGSAAIALLWDALRN